MFEVTRAARGGVRVPPPGRPGGGSTAMVPSCLCAGLEGTRLLSQPDVSATGALLLGPRRAWLGGTLGHKAQGGRRGLRGLWRLLRESEATPGVSHRLRQPQGCQLCLEPRPQPRFQGFPAQGNGGTGLSLRVGVWPQEEGTRPEGQGCPLRGPRGLVLSGSSS